MLDLPAWDEVINKEVAKHAAAHIRTIGEVIDEKTFAFLGIRQGSVIP